MLPQFLRGDAFGMGVDPGSLVQHLRYHIDDELAKLDGMGKRAERAVRDLRQVANRHVDLAICVDTQLGKGDAARLAVEVGALRSVGRVVERLGSEEFECVTVRRRNPWEDVTFLFGVNRDDFL
jgi:hypothetical protein